MNATEASQSLGNIHAKRKYIAELREKFEATMSSHWLVSEHSPTQIKAFLKAGEADQIIERLTAEERVKLVEISGQARQSAIPRPQPKSPAAEESSNPNANKETAESDQEDERPLVVDEVRRTAGTKEDKEKGFRLPDTSKTERVKVGVCSCGCDAFVLHKRGISPGVWTEPLPFCDACHAKELMNPGDEIPEYNPDNVEIPEEEPAATFELEDSKQARERLERKTSATDEEIPEVPGPDTGEDPADLLRRAMEAMKSRTPAAIDESVVRRIANEEIDKRPVPAPAASESRREHVITLTRREMPDLTLSGRQHYRFPLIVASITAEVPILITGPAGSGKTSAALNAAKLLGLHAVPMSFSPMTTEAALVGFVDAGGTYRQTGFVDAFRNGAVFVADEFDAARPDVAIKLNSAVGNRILTLPTGEIVEAHQNFQFVACANTYGTGPDATYTGRNRLDGATLDRLFTLAFPHDDGLEAALVGVEVESPPCDLASGGAVTAVEWLATVQGVRELLDESGEDVVISQRATLMGVALASVGVGRDWLFEGLLLKGLRGTTRNAVESFR
jgi:hypothetical protein